MSNVDSDGSDEKEYSEGYKAGQEAERLRSEEQLSKEKDLTEKFRQSFSKEVDLNVSLKKEISELKKRLKETQREERK